jgi:metal-responsive CopG/Arc/MetJ family transcriptional regulator
MVRRADKDAISLRINHDLLVRVDAHAEDIGRTRSEVIHRALEEYLENHEGDGRDEGGR